MTEKNNSHFGVGFSLGVLAGAAGYFLFGTKRGQKIRDELAAEWDAAREHLIDEGVLDKKKQTLSQFFSELKLKTLESFELESEPVSKKSKTKRAYKRKKRPQQFKGV